MTEFVSTLLHVALHGARYVFIVSNTTEFKTAVQQALIRESKELGRGIKSFGRVVLPHQEDADRIARDLLAMDWPVKIRELMTSEIAPFIVVIETDFPTFVPTQNRWAIIWLQQFGKRPGDALARIFQRVKRWIINGDDLLEVLDQSAAKPDSIFPCGSLSTWGHPIAVFTSRGPGRPGLLGGTYGLDQEIDRLIRECNAAQGTGEFADELTTKVFEWCREHDVSWKRKSIRAALRRAGYFKDAGSATRPSDVKSSAKSTPQSKLKAAV